MEIVLNNVTIGKITFSVNKEEADILMERLGTPTIEEMVTAERNEDIAQMVKGGMDPAEAAGKWESDHIKAAMEYQAGKPKPAEPSEAVAPAQHRGSEDSGLHLDGPPPQRAAQPKQAEPAKAEPKKDKAKEVIGVSELVKLARSLDTQGKSGQCAEMLKAEFGIDRLMQTPPEKAAQVYLRLKEIEAA